MNKPAAFIHDNGIYYPANKNAVGVCAVLSKMTLRESDMLAVRSKGYVPMLVNGQEIGKIGIEV